MVRSTRDREKAVRSVGAGSTTKSGGQRRRMGVMAVLLGRRVKRATTSWRIASTAANKSMRETKVGCVSFAYEKHGLLPRRPHLQPSVSIAEDQLAKVA